MLLLRKLTEELDLLLASGFPIIVRLERALEVCLNVHVECLRFQLAIRRIVHARNSLRRCQMVQVRRQLVEFCARRLLL